MAVQLAAIPAQSVHAFDVVTVAAVLASGSDQPDSYAFTLLPNADVHVVTLAGTGASRTYLAPGRFAGCTVNVKVDAVKAGVVADTKTAVATVAAHSDYMWSAGSRRWVAISRPRPVVAGVTGGLTTEDGRQLTSESGLLLTVG